MSKLFAKHGDEIYTLLDKEDVATLAIDLGEEDASNFVEAWKEHVSGSVTFFLQAHKFPF